MRTCLLSMLSLSLIFTLPAMALLAQDGAPKAAPAKQIPTEGHFEIQITAGDREKTFSHPAKALTDINRAVSRAKRAAEGEEPAFEAILTLNNQQFTFSDPEAAFEACQALTTAMRDLPKLRMGLGDLGEIPEVKQEDQAAANPQTTAGGMPKAAAIAEVRRRINAALRQQLGGSGRGGRPSMPNPLTIQRTIQEEVEKARQEGLLPAANAANAGGGFGGGDPREAKKEAIVQTLAFAFSQADSVGPAGGESPEAKPKDGDPKAAKPSEEKPANPKAEESKEN